MSDTKGTAKTEATTNAKAEAKADDVKPRGSGKLLIALMLTNTLLAGGALASTWLRPSIEAARRSGAHADDPTETHDANPDGGAEDGKAHDGKPGEAAAPPSIARIDNIVVRLRNPESDRFARMTLDIELASAADLASFQANLPKVRDAIITTISDRGAEQLAGSAGILKLKEELGPKISAAIGGRGVKTVYLSEFVVQ